MSSTPTKALAAAAAVLLAAACGTSTGGPRTGSALQGGGPAMFGTSGYPHAKIGVVYRFSFPLLKNVSKAPVALTGFKVLSVPGQVQVRGYTVSSVNDTPGYLLGGLDTDFTKYPDYAKKTLIIKPGATSPYYAGVRVQASGKLAHHIKGCDITYQQNDHTYHQVLPCEYALDVT